MNLSMPTLKQALEGAGFKEVRTLLSSGNAVLVANVRSAGALESMIEKVLESELGRTFMTFVRPIALLEAMIASDPYAEFALASDAKRVVTFLRQAPSMVDLANLKFPIEQDGAQILAIRNLEVFTAYVRSPRGPVFMKLIEKNFGKNTTTRTWETVKKVVR